MKKIILKLLLLLFSFFLISIWLYFLFLPLFKAKNIIFPFAITPFDIAKEYPKIWDFIKKTYFIFLFFSYVIIFNYIYNIFQKLHKSNKNVPKIQLQNNNNNLKLLIGKNNNTNVIIDEFGLYQNILVTGTIGSRKNLFCNVSFYSTINSL